MSSQYNKKFKKTEEDKYMCFFHNRIKENVLNKYCKNYSLLLDFACGQSGDIWKWINIGIRNVIGFDNSKELQKIAFERFPDGFPMKFKYVLHDLKKPLKFQKEEFADHISCFFAIHYFFESEEVLTTFILNVAKCLKDSGYFIGTTFDGERIIKYMKECKKNETNEKGIYAITKQYDDEDFTGFTYGHTIIVHRGRSAGGKGIQEYLVFFDILEKICQNFNLYLVNIIPFEEIYIKEKKYCLNYLEKNISFLNSVFIFQKKSK